MNSVANVGQRFQPVGRTGESGCAAHLSASIRVHPWLQFSGYAGPTGQPKDWSYSFVGNEVIGGRHGVMAPYPSGTVTAAGILVSGNVISNYPAFPLSDDYPGSVVVVSKADSVNVSGNTLVQGGMGVWVPGYCTNLFVVGNFFSHASYRSLADDGDAAGLISAQVAKNRLGQGVTFHLRGLAANDLVEGQKYFLLQNWYYDTNYQAMPPFLDPLALPVHFQ